MHDEFAKSHTQRVLCVLRAQRVLCVLRALHVYAGHHMHRRTRNLLDAQDNTG